MQVDVVRRRSGCRWLRAIAAPDVGADVGAHPPTTCLTPHEVDSHGVLENASSRSTSLSTHQPRSWSKAEASLNMSFISVIWSTCQPPSGRLKDEAYLNMSLISSTLLTDQLPMSWSNDEAEKNM